MLYFDKGLHNGAKFGLWFSYVVNQQAKKTQDTRYKGKLKSVSKINLLYHYQSYAHFACNFNA